MNTNNQSGFSLVELVIAVLIIGILSAISIPALLTSVNRAKEIEALQNLGVLADQQKVYFAGKNEFPANLSDLGFNQSVLKHYDITTKITDKTEGVETLATPKSGLSNALRAYRMCVFLSHSASTGEANLTSERKDAANPTVQPADCPQIPVNVP